MSNFSGPKYNFASGVYTKTAPQDFVHSKMSINYDAFSKWVQTPEVQQHIKDNEGYLKIDTLYSKDKSKLFSKLNTLQKKKEVTSAQHSPDRNTNGDNAEDLPF
jgi:hypothetical protein|tara:strand:- start:511 stop:822 length:312 start_codon:yes stop_codon:yes gene_type:complete